VSDDYFTCNIFKVKMLKNRCSERRRLVEERAKKLGIGPDDVLTKGAGPYACLSCKQDKVVGMATYTGVTISHKGKEIMPEEPEEFKELRKIVNREPQKKEEAMGLTDKEEKPLCKCGKDLNHRGRCKGYYAGKRRTPDAIKPAEVVQRPARGGIADIDEARARYVAAVLNLYTQKINMVRKLYALLEALKECGAEFEMPEKVV
jgi:hypothetical protein